MVTLQPVSQLPHTNKTPIFIHLRETLIIRVLFRQKSKFGHPYRSFRNFYDYRAFSFDVLLLYNKVAFTFFLKLVLCNKMSVELLQLAFRIDMAEHLCMLSKFWSSSFDVMSFYCTDHTCL